MIDRTELAAAMAILVAGTDEADEAANAYNHIRSAARIWPVQFTPGTPMDKLNVLLELERIQPEMAQQMRTMIDQRRMEKGRDPFWTPKPGFDTNTYQREYMDRKRRRQRRASEIENLNRPAADQLIGNARLDFENKTHAEWMEKLNEKLDNAKAAATLIGEKLTREQQRVIRDTYWAKIDAQLDEAEEAVRRKNQNL